MSNPLDLVHFDNTGQVLEPVKTVSEMARLMDQGHKFVLYEMPYLPEVNDDEPVGQIRSVRVTSQHTTYSTDIYLDGDYYPLGMNHTSLLAACITLWRAWQFAMQFEEEALDLR